MPYLATLMEGLKAVATTERNTNVLTHLLGYFKKHLTDDERKVMVDLIEMYHRSLVPLAVPIVLFTHYVRNYNEPYLARKYYLNPHPVELMMRNHV